MHRGVPRQTLQLSRHLNQLVHSFVAVISLFQIRILLQCLIQRDIQFIRNHLGDRIAEAVRKIHRAPDIANDAPCCHGSEGDDLHHLILAILTCDIIDDFLSSLEAEVHVNIGHGYALRIQKALEQQRVPDRVKLRDAGAVGYHRARRGASSRAHRNSMLSRPVDVIPDNQEVVDISHFPDDRELIIEPFSYRSVIVRIAARKAVVTKLVQICPGIIPLRHREVRQLRFAEFNGDIAAIRNFLRIVQSFLCVREELSHLFLALDIELSARIAHPVLIADLFACLNAEKNIVCLRVICKRIMAVIGRDHRNIELPRQLKDPCNGSLLVRIAVILQLQEEISLSENILVFQCCLLCRLLVTAHKVSCDLARKARRGADDSLMEFTQKLLVDPWLIIIAFRKGTADNFG